MVCVSLSLSVCVGMCVCMCVYVCVTYVLHPLQQKDLVIIHTHSTLRIGQSITILYETGMHYNLQSVTVYTRGIKRFSPNQVLICTEMNAISINYMTTLSTAAILKTRRPSGYHNVIKLGLLVQLFV